MRIIAFCTVVGGPDGGVGHELLINGLRWDVHYAIDDVNDAVLSHNVGSNDGRVHTGTWRTTNLLGGKKTKQNK